MVDGAAGRARAAIRGSVTTRAKRWDALAKRATRLQHLRGHARKRATNLYVAGVKSALVYCASVNGLAPAGRKRLRAAAAPFLRPWDAGAVCRLRSR